MTIKLNDPALEGKVGKAMENDGEARLPFSAPVFWVMNGNNDLKEIGGARYFGGWATNAEELEAHATECNIAIPANLKKSDFTPRGSEESVSIYSARFLTVVPIAKRLSSVYKETKERVPGYSKGASPHLQVACYCSFKEKDGNRLDWSPIVLSAKGFQVGNVLDAFTKWSKSTNAARKQFANGLSAELFYLTIGTFGDKPNIRKVGTGETSPITPVMLYVPPSEIGEKDLEYLFVGDGLAAEIANLRAQSQEWMDAWKSPKKPENGNGNGNGHLEPIIEQEPVEEEMPF